MDAPGLRQLSIFAEEAAELVDLEDDDDLQAIVASIKCNEEPYVQVRGRQSGVEVKVRHAAG